MREKEGKRGVEGERERELHESNVTAIILTTIDGFA